MMNKFLILNNALRNCILATIFIAFLVASLPALAVSAPTRTDDRIKTLVFSENEVYTVVTRSGFNTAIEISRKEKIEAISLGSQIGWQITPAKNRIFIKPLLKNNTTNLTIITNKRTYQFELVVSSAQIKNASHAYLVKFFYPDEGRFGAAEDRTRGDSRPVSATTIPEPPAFVPALAPEMVRAPVSSMSGLPSLGSIGIQAYNFNYTLTGPEDKSPKKIFDDGSSTYFEYDYPLNSTPRISVVNPDGSESVLNVRSEGNKYVVNSIAPRFVINGVGASEQICVFNEALLTSSAGSANAGMYK